MQSFVQNVLVPLFFLHAAFGTLVLAWWFSKRSKQVSKDFGMGMLGYGLGILVWAAVVIIKPSDIRPMVLLGVVPFLLAHLAYARAASNKLPFKGTTLVSITTVLVVATFLARTFFYPSQPYFSSNGLLFFGLMPVPVALYIATISVSFLPAIGAVVDDLKKAAVKSVMSIGLMVLYINALVLVSAKDDTLLLINGLVMSLALLVLWVKALSSPPAKA